MMQKRTFTAGALLLIAIGGVAWAAGGRTVYYHGSAMSSGVTVVNGQPYVPLADVARALGGKVAPHAGGYEIVSAAAGGSGSPAGGAPATAAGGANEIKGIRGKVGDLFFNGYWRFQVSRVEHVDHYTYQYGTNTGDVKPSNPNDELVVFYCTIKNGHKDAEEPILTQYGLATQHTALTDDQGQSFAPADFDSRGGKLVPGAARNFAVAFSVPKNTHLNDLIYTVYGYGETSGKPTDVRVSLAP